MKEMVLDKITSILSGFAFNSKSFRDKGELPLIRIRDVKRGYTETYYTGDYDPTYLIKNGDLLVGMDGEFNTEKWRGGKALLNQRVCKITTDENELFLNYLYYFLPKALKRIEDQTPWVTVKHLSVKKIKEIKIPLPPLEEQKRIATILDKADALRRKRQQAIDLSNQFLRSVFLDMFGDPVTNPKGWLLKSIGDLVERIDSGWSPKCENRVANENEWGVLKLSAVTSCVFKAEENKALPVNVEPKSQLEAKNGDLLFTRKNTYELVAASALVGETRGKLMLSDTIFRLKLNEKSGITPQFLWSTMTHKGFRQKLQKLASGAAGSMPNISKEKLKNAQVPIPTPELIKTYSLLYTKQINLIKKINKSIDLMKDSFNSLSQKAFRGEL